jgi:hypothetical protein
MGYLEERWIARSQKCGKAGWGFLPRYRSYALARARSRCAEPLTRIPGTGVSTG